MSMQVKALTGAVINLLKELEPPKGASSIVFTPTSQVAQDSPCRFVLESIRSDLFHFDEDKRERIIYSINSLLKMYRPEIKDLVVTLERIKEVIRHFKGTGDILQSPVKQATSPSKKGTCKTTTVRKLFFDS